MEKKRILLADDIEIFVRMERSFLPGDRFEFLTARTGRQALEIIDREFPDLVFLDLHLPEMEGTECCAAVKRNDRTRSIPIVIVTDDFRPEVIQECRNARCDGILKKPLVREEFVMEVKRHLVPLPVQEPRFPARLSVYHGHNAEEMLSDYSVNLSTGGLFLETSRLLPVDSPLIVSFSLPEGRGEIVCNARVAWLNGPEAIRKPDLPVGMGIRFTDLTMEAMDAIRDFLTTRAITVAPPPQPVDRPVLHHP